MAAVSDDGHTLVFRLEHPNAQPFGFNASVVGAQWVDPRGSCTAVTLTGNDLDATNDFDTPNNVMPVASCVSCARGGVRAVLPPFSFTVVTLVAAAPSASPSLASESGALFVSAAEPPVG
jgi:alpha-L-arabinofuranosidase